MGPTCSTTAPILMAALITPQDDEAQITSSCGTKHSHWPSHPARCRNTCARNIGKAIHNSDSAAAASGTQLTKKKATVCAHTKICPGKCSTGQPACGSGRGQPKTKGEAQRSRAG